MRFKLSTLFISIAVVAVITAAMMNPYALVVEISQIVVTTILTASILLSIYNAPSSRSFWLGFAICGWLLVSDYSWDPMMYPSASTPLTKQVFEKLYDTIHSLEAQSYPRSYPPLGPSYPPGPPPSLWPPYSQPPTSSASTWAAEHYQNRPRFVTLGETFTSLLVALVGGCFSRFLYQRNVRPLQNS